MPKLRILGDTIGYDGKFLQLIERRFRNRSGKIAVWEMVRRKTYGRIVAVVALTPKHEILLTKTYRVPLKSWVIEFCAGLMDKKGESERRVARRELLEETGYAVKRLRKLIAGPFNTGLLTDEMVIYLGTDARKIREQRLEDGEDIEVLKIPLRKLHRWLTRPPRGVKVDLKLFAVLYFLKKRYTGKGL